MAKELSHEDIAQRFVDAKVIDFNAMGKLITELGPSLAVNDQGWHGISFGRWNWWNCYMPAVDAMRLVGSLPAAALTTRVLEESRLK
jgi:hypothetical protein